MITTSRSTSTPLRLCFCLLNALALLQLPSTAAALAIDVPTSNVGTNNKAGLAWGATGDVSMSQYTSTGKVSWYYDWSPQSWVQRNNLEYVPMLWGAKDLSQWNSTINTTIQTYPVTAILGMNEPDQSGQANLSPQAASEMWMTYIQPLKAQGLRLGSPATASEPSAIDWVQQFLGNCSSCEIDFVAMHWYGTNATQFVDYLNNFHDTLQKPLWITEWACQNMDGGPQCSETDVQQFMNVTQSFMDSTDWVERYAWFGAMQNLAGVNPDNGLMSSSGTINTLGEQYINGTANSTTPAAGSASMTIHSNRWLALASMTAVAALLL